MESSFGNFAKLLWPETQKILAQCPKVRKVLFLQEIWPLECSAGHVECILGSFNFSFEKFVDT